jgi:hypothetical protein
LANLQLLEAIPNIEKNDCDFDKWIADTIPSDAINNYKTKHFIPQDIELNFSNFESFFTMREELIIDKLKKELM